MANPGEILDLVKRSQRGDREAFDALIARSREAVIAVLHARAGAALRRRTEVEAARMGRSGSSVKNLLLRALRPLRQNFGDTESLHLPQNSLSTAHEEEAPPQGR